MPKKKAGAARYRHTHPALDLFGEVPITFDDLRAWVAAMTRLDPDSSRAEWYIKNWNVADKVRAAKLAGTFEATIGPPDRRGILRQP